MCAVSAVINGWTNPYSPNFIQSLPGIPPTTARDMLRVIELLERIDKKLDAQNCAVAEPEKKKFKAKLRRRSQQ